MSEEQPKYKCHICLRRCYTKEELEKHLEWHFTPIRTKKGED